MGCCALISFTLPKSLVTCATISVAVGSGLKKRGMCGPLGGNENSLEILVA
jgi:hypothetical protein